MKYSITNLELPTWMVDVPFDQYWSIVNACRRVAVDAFYKKLDEIYRQRREREALESSGQLSIDDYV